MYIDCHCHLDLINIFDTSINDILQNSRKLKINSIVQVSASINEFKTFFPVFSKNFLYKNELPYLYFTFGVSPNDLSYEAFDFSELLDLFLHFDLIEHMNNGKLVAIGEIGLDYFHKFFTSQEQKNAFEVQLQLAKKYNLPVMLHIRDAFDDAIAILKNADISSPIIFHCYTGDPEITTSILENFENCAFSFAGNITYKKMENIQKSLLIIPIEKILLETDSPYLSPGKLRGKENVPYNVIQTYDFVANLLGVSLESLCNQIRINAKNFMNIF